MGRRFFVGLAQTLIRLGFESAQTLFGVWSYTALTPINAACARRIADEQIWIRGWIGCWKDWLRE